MDIEQVAGIKEVWQSVLDWFGNSNFFSSLNENLGFIAWFILLVLAIIWLGERIIKFLTKRIVRPPKRTEPLTTDEYRRRVATALSVFKTVWRMFMMVVAITIIVAKLKLPLGPITAAFGAAGVALGFGAQSLVRDFINGIFIISENQYKIGDYVELEGFEGTVEHITMRATVLRDMDGNVHHIPNGNIKASTNQTSGFSRMVVALSVDGETDLKKVEKVVNEVGQELLKDEDWEPRLKEAPYLARVVDFEGSSVKLSVWARTKPGNQWQTASEFRKRLKEAFDKAGIKLG